MKPQLNVVDSSGWLEYFGDSPQAKLFAPAIDDVRLLIVPVITIYEVYKRRRRDAGERAGLTAAASMQMGRVVPIDLELALEASTLSLPLADSLIYATARRFGATLWTQDEHFASLEGVRYFPKS